MRVQIHLCWWSTVDFQRVYLQYSYLQGLDCEILECSDPSTHDHQRFVNNCVLSKSWSSIFIPTRFGQSTLDDPDPSALDHQWLMVNYAYELSKSSRSGLLASWLHLSGLPTSWTKYFFVLFVEYNPNVNNPNWLTINILTIKIWTIRILIVWILTVHWLLLTLELIT